jgi:hypothetical protein
MKVYEAERKEAADRIEQIKELYLEYVDLAEERAARIKRLEVALQAMLHAVCSPTGFAAAVRADSGKAYPWITLEHAEQMARAALGEKKDGQD